MATSASFVRPSSFLAGVAQYYWKQYGINVSDLCFVFPNRRAGLFFRKYLAEQAQQPLFAPDTITVEQLFRTLSGLRVADNVDLLFRLYKVYDKHYLMVNGRQETFDDFVFWGRMMLADFDDVDTCLVDARKLFSNLADLKDIELRFKTLQEEQQISLQAFMEGFQKDTQDTFRDKFVCIWQCLFSVYQALREDLQREGLAYMGMLQRGVVEALKTEAVTLTDKSRYVFVGFNALTPVEEALMLFLKEQGKAEFHFDYEAEWLRDTQNRASFFREHNLSLFPPAVELPVATKVLPAIHLVKVPSYVGQAGQVYRLLRQLTEGHTDIGYLTGIGIVLPDEHMLMPLMNAIPGQIRSINVTMGFPLASTPLYALLQHLSELQLLNTGREKHSAFHYKPVLGILHHPYLYDRGGERLAELERTIVRSNMTYVPASFFADDELLRHVFCRLESAQDVVRYLSQLMYMLIDDDAADASEKNEYIRHTLLLINRLQIVLQRYEDVSMQVPTFYNLLLNLCGSLSVPFEGEPLQGLQIMGVLEARGMDFHTLIVTDFNDETFPGGGVRNSYIPYDLRCAFGLSTPERQDAVSAYNFYRLISYAKDVYLLQNTVSDERTSGEESRYLHQLRYQYGITIEESTVGYVPRTISQEPVVVPKTKEVMAQTLARLCPSEENGKGKGLSPSALNTYVQCPLRFYLAYICGLREADRIEENIRNDKFGTILHSVLERLYKPFAAGISTSILVTEDDICSMQKRLYDDYMVERAYGEVFLHTDGGAVPALQGKDYLPVKVIQRYVEAVLEHDKTLAGGRCFRYIAGELDCQARFVTTNGTEVCFHGIIDRVDEVGGRIRIVDYKTGKEHSTFPEPAMLFSPDKGKADHICQTLVYSLLFNATVGTNLLYPHIYYVKNGAKGMEHAVRYAGKEDGAPAMETYADMQSVFEQALRQVLDEILDSDIPFVARPDYTQNGHCHYCPFASLCGIQG